VNATAKRGRPKMPAKATSPKSVAHAFVRAINERDVGKIEKLMADDHRFIDSLGAVMQGKTRMREGWAAYFRVVPDYAITIEETFSNGATVFMLGVAGGTYTSDGQLRPENSWKTPAAWRAQIKGNKVAEWRVYADNEPIRQRMAKPSERLAECRSKNSARSESGTD